MTSIHAVAHCQYCAGNISELAKHTLQDGAQCLLCKDCGRQLKSMISKSTKPTADLYFSLIQKGIAAKLEKFAGQDTATIYVAPVSLKITVTGNSLLQDPHKALNELINTFQNLKKEILTVKIPHALVTSQLHQVSSYITAMIKLRQLNWAMPFNNTEYFA